MNIGPLRGARLIYLATPYTKFPGGIESAFIAAARVAATLMRGGLSVYSPIAHTHPIAIHGEIDPLDHSIWMPFDSAMMGASSHLLVAMLPTWRQSYGIKVEIETFREVAKPIFYLDTETMTIEADADVAQ